MGQGGRTKEKIRDGRLGMGIVAFKVKQTDLLGQRFCVLL
jgi:hypothetical protein